MPKDHSYFAEIQKAWKYNLQEDAAIPFVMSLGLIILSGVLVYKCFFENTTKQKIE